MSAQVEQWRVSTPEGVFETDLETLKQWIAEGCVLPTDKVSKGNLNWIEAGRAPMLRLAFSFKAGEASTMSPTAPEKIGTGKSLPEPFSQPDPWGDAAVHSTTAVTQFGKGNVCQNHSAVSAHYVCRVCAAKFCETCPRFVNSIPICPACGDLCKVFEQERTKVVRQEFQASGFGFADFARAMRYPLQHKFALLCGAAMYGLLMLAGLRGHAIAYVVMFGCISHVISQVAWGRLNRSFMPDFTSFSMWDDFAVPLGLGIGITLVTWGPVIVLVLALVFGIRSAPAAIAAGDSGHVSQQNGITSEDLSVLTDSEADPKQLEEANRKLEQTRMSNQISEQAERSRKEQNDPMAGAKLLLPYLKAGLIIVLLFLAALAWAIFYYPMALTVAGYTQSFASVVNPLVGLDTIRRMGSTYFKAFGMVLLLQVVGFVITAVVAIITAPLALPFLGNLPAKFIDGSVTFYFNLVIACLLGLSLYKCANRLGINVD